MIAVTPKPYALRTNRALHSFAPMRARMEIPRQWNPNGTVNRHPKMMILFGDTTHRKLLKTCSHLIINKTMPQKHNNTAKTERIFDSSATETNIAVIATIFASLEALITDNIIAANSLGAQTKTH